MARYPLSYRGREGRYHVVVPEKADDDMSVTLPLDPEPDLPLYPMAFFKTSKDEFYGEILSKEAYMEEQRIAGSLILRNNELFDRPRDWTAGREDSVGGRRIIEFMNTGRMHAYLPGDSWEGESSHISLLIKKDLDPVAVAASENGRLLEEVFRLKDLNQKVFDGIGYGIAVLDSSMRIRHSNDTYVTLMDSPGACVQGKLCLWSENPSPLCPFCAAQETIDNGTFHCLEVKRTTPDGMERWMRIDTFPLADAKGTIESVIEVIRDISDIKKLQTSLEQEKGKIEAVISGMAESLYIVDTDLRLSFLHSGSFMKFENTQKEHIGEKCYEALFDRTFPCPWCRVRETFKSGEVVRRVAFLRDETGHDRHFQITFSPWRDARGRVLSAICLLVDITQQKLMEQKIIKSEKLSSLAVLSAGMAHELNNPLGATNFNLEVLKKRQSDPVCIEILDEIKKDMKRINRIVGNLLSFSRTGSHAYKPICLKEVADTALDLLRMVIKKSGIEVTKSYLDNAALVHGNSQDLQQVFVNLTSNALDAMPAGGKINISIRQAGESGREKVEVIFADTGIGITPDKREKIFDPFFTTKAEIKGIGLGLSVVHKILENHSATIEVESEPGKGTSFSILFPRFWPSESGDGRKSYSGKELI